MKEALLRLLREDDEVKRRLRSLFFSWGAGEDGNERVGASAGGTCLTAKPETKGEDAAHHGQAAAASPSAQDDAAQRGEVPRRKLTLSEKAWENEKKAWAAAVASLAAEKAEGEKTITDLKAEKDDLQAALTKEKDAIRTALTEEKEALRTALTAEKDALAAALAEERARAGAESAARADAEKALQAEKAHGAKEKKEWSAKVDDLKGELKKAEARLRAQDADLARRFPEGWAIFQSYARLSDPTRSALQRVFPRAEDFPSFIFSGAQPGALEQIWDILKESWEKERGKDLPLLEALFQYVLSFANRSSREPVFERLAVGVGDAFDAKTQFPIPDGRAQGSVAETYVQGFRNRYAKKIIRQTIVKLT